MKTGFLRTIDDIGRIVIPQTIRENMCIISGDQFEIIEDGCNIILARYTATCLACDDDTDVQKINRTYLCVECREAVHKTL